MNRIKVVDGRVDINRYWLNTSIEDIDDEKWEGCVFYDKNDTFYDLSNSYLISNKGRVKALKRIDSRNQHRYIKILKQDSNGTYLRVMLSDMGVKFRMSVHRLVLFAFKQRIENKNYANHKNAIRTDNTDGNLEWATCAENIQYAYDIGTKIKTKGFIEGFHKRDKDNYQYKGVHKIDLETGVILATFDCYREAGESLGVKFDSIKHCANGRSKTAFGYKWQKVCIPL